MPSKGFARQHKAKPGQAERARAADHCVPCVRKQGTINTLHANLVGERSRADAFLLRLKEEGDAAAAAKAAAAAATAAAATKARNATRRKAAAARRSCSAIERMRLADKRWKMSQEAATTQAVERATTQAVEHMNKFLKSYKGNGKKTGTFCRRRKDGSRGVQKSSRQLQCMTSAACKQKADERAKRKLKKKKNLMAEARSK